MTVKEYLNQNPNVKYIITDRMRVPISADLLKWLKLEEIDIRKVETLEDGSVKIHTDYMHDAC